MTRPAHAFYSIYVSRRKLPSGRLAWATWDWRVEWWPEITVPGRYPRTHTVGRGTSFFGWSGRLAARGAVRRHQNPRVAKSFSETIEPS